MELTVKNFSSEMISPNNCRGSSFEKRGCYQNILIASALHICIIESTMILCLSITFVRLEDIGKWLEDTSFKHWPAITSRSTTECSVLSSKHDAMAGFNHRRGKPACMFLSWSPCKRWNLNEALNSRGTMVKEVYQRNRGNALPTMSYKVHKMRPGFIRRTRDSSWFGVFFDKYTNRYIVMEIMAKRLSRFHLLYLNRGRYVRKQLFKSAGSSINKLMFITKLYIMKAYFVFFSKTRPIQCPRIFSRNGILLGFYTMELPTQRQNIELVWVSHIEHNELTGQAFVIYVYRTVENKQTSYYAFGVFQIAVKNGLGDEFNYTLTAGKELDVHIMPRLLHRFPWKLLFSVFVTASEDVLVTMRNCVHLFTKRSFYQQKVPIIADTKRRAWNFKRGYYRIRWDSANQIMMLANEVNKARRDLIVTYIPIQKNFPHYWYYRKSYQSTIISNVYSIADGRNGSFVAYFSYGRMYLKFYHLI
ncbi:uncharacterized protein LOC135503042 [Lineus longissimus]|uniref:uncharacterized protein LOC135503042 n=1 Tax=Lineus longissimus TaxID=88925 RepID=UPI002B4DEFE4